jgi:hypothetical protein
LVVENIEPEVIDHCKTRPTFDVSDELVGPENITARRPAARKSHPRRKASDAPTTGAARNTMTVRKSKTKVQLLRLAEKLDNVSEACRELGYSRDSFYRFKKLYENAGEDALENTSRKKPNLKNRVAVQIENAIVELALEEPLWGQEKTARQLRKRGLMISPAGVRCVWLRHGLETMGKRAAALEARSLESGYILTETQLAALRSVNKQRRRPKSSEKARR